MDLKSSSLLTYVMSSEVRKKTLYRLLEEPLLPGDLKDLLGVSSPYLSPRLKQMENRCLIYKDDGKYHLTSVGELIIKHILRADQLSGLLEAHGKFFNEHDLSALPHSLAFPVGDPEACRLIENNMENVNATYSELIEKLPASKSVIGISPIFDPAFPEIIVSVAQRGAPVSIILTEKIYNIVEECHSDGLRAYLACNNARLYTIDDARLALLVTESFASLSLCHKNGGFDANTNLMSIDKAALRCGEELFEYYRRRSKQVKL